MIEIKMTCLENPIIQVSLVIRDLSFRDFALHGEFRNALFTYNAGHLYLKLDFGYLKAQWGSLTPEAR
jgi:hypothetical protein